MTMLVQSNLPFSTEPTASNLHDSPTQSNPPTVLTSTTPSKTNPPVSDPNLSSFLVKLERKGNGTELRLDWWRGVARRQLPRRCATGARRRHGDVGCSSATRCTMMVWTRTCKLLMVDVLFMCCPLLCSCVVLLVLFKSAATDGVYETTM